MSKITSRTTISTKLTVAFVGVSLIGIFIVGLSTKTMLMNGFDTMVADRANAGFIGHITDYYKHYGSWEAAQNGDTFVEFNIKRNIALNRPSRNKEANSNPGKLRPDNLGLGFFVVDENGKTLLQLGRRQIGESVDERILDTAVPINIDDVVIGYSVYESRPTLSREEAVYVQSLNQSLFLAFIAAMAVAIPLGIFLADRLSMPIRELTNAAKAISDGDFSQVVEIKTNDELGELGESFNKMSSELAESKTQLTEYSEELFELSRRDELTGLNNRRAFDESIKQLYSTAIRYEQNLSIAMIDIDNFKSVNDKNSHHFGDLVLKAISKVLTDNIRDVDIAARFGGDEFVIAYPYTSEENAMIISERLRASIAEIRDWDKDNSDTQITVSMGISGVKFGKSLEDMMNKADQNLCRAKEDGRNCVLS